ncbi:hypothetical protein [Paenibacillus caui]|uniref:hypothetical protein n=1 Tax=Paenibacillus caui TaxID=2873927 RepID=UPI001CA85574|nr:hypothetical protein [Paenibacillus caui]
MQKKLCFFLLILVLLVPATLVNAKNQSQLNEDVGYIDSRLPEKDKEILKEVMKNLDKEDRENVLFIDEDGYFTMNKLDKLNEYKEKYKELIGPDGKLKRDPNYKEKTVNLGEAVEPNVSILSYTNPTTSCPSANSGPFRKIASAKGYSRITTNLYLPIKGTDISMTPKTVNTPNGPQSTYDTAYMYVGAYNVGTDGNTYTVDAGLMFNYGDSIDPVYPTEETWAMTSLGMSSVISGSPANFKMGTSAFMKFYIPTSNQAALYVTGTAKNGTPLSQTIVWNVSSIKNFSTYGTNMQVKRITAIGQKYEDLTTGSYLYNAQWSDVKVGTASGTEQLQNAASTATSCGYQTYNVLVDFTDFSRETVKVKTGTLTP